MKVIGAGIGRTGTMSLKAALEQLGFGPCFHGRHVLDHRDRLPLWLAASSGEPVDWPLLFEGYQSTMDWPGAAFWRQLIATWPDAKVILTERDPDRWYDSVARTIYPMFGSHTDPRAAEARAVVPGLDVMTDFTRRLIWDGPFFNGRFEDRDVRDRRVSPPQRGAYARRCRPTGCSCAGPTSAGRCSASSSGSPCPTSPIPTSTTRTGSGVGSRPAWPRPRAAAEAR